MELSGCFSIAMLWMVKCLCVCVCVCVCSVPKKNMGFAVEHDHNGDESKTIIPCLDG